MSDFFEYAQREALWLFPCRAGTKIPTLKWTAESSSMPEQWAEWQSAGYNFAINAAKSDLLIVDIDASKVGRDSAWSAWSKLCKAWDLPEALLPQCQSARGGWHVYIKRPADIDAAKLSGGKIVVKISDTRPLEKSEKDGEIVAIKNRGYAVAPGSYLSTENGNLPYRMMTEVLPPYECPPALIVALKLPVIECQSSGRGGEAEIADVAAVIAALDAVGEFDSEPEWFKALGAIKLALGDTEQAIEVAKQITWGEVDDDTFYGKWRRLSTEPRPNDFKIGSLIKRAEEVTGQRFSVRKSLSAMFKEVETGQSLSIVPPEPTKNLVLSDAEFVADFVPPEYVLDGILQRGYCYSLTAQTGAGKTAIALQLAVHIGLGRRLGDRDVQQGSIIYFASENSVDVQARWIAMAEHCGFEVGKTNVNFVVGATRLSEIADRIRCEVENGNTDLALVVVDTSAATFEGEDENNNVHAIEHAKRMRSLTALRGRPTVLVLCHPTKRAGADDLIPRGGGSFLAEVDGNLCARKSDSAVELHWAGKFRGMEFAPMLFELRTVTATRLRDRRGRSIPTVLAALLDDAARQAMAAAGRKDEDQVLRAVEANPGASLNDLAKVLGWTMRDGRPYSMKVKRASDKLAADALIYRHRDAWALTPKGEKELNSMDMRATYPLTPNNVDAQPRVMAPSIFQGAKPN